MIKVIKVKTTQDAKLAERFTFEALKPGGFASNPDIPIASLKDQLAWLSWANIKRSEQPTFIAKEKGKIIAGIFGEPVEQWFDKGESEIQELLFRPAKENDDIAMKLLSKIIDFYRENKAKQVHFWVLEKNFNKNKFEPWQKIAMDSFGFSFKGFRRTSKWSGKPIVKIEKYF
jgi:hypothetical protein